MFLAIYFFFELDMSLKVKKVFFKAIIDLRPELDPHSLDAHFAASNELVFQISKRYFVKHTAQCGTSQVISIHRRTCFSLKA